MRRLALGTLLIASAATAKEVEISWDKVENASSYDVRITDRAGKTETEGKVAGATWRTELAPGVHFYQIRAIDRINRAGAWSMPARLVVMPPTPTVLQPKARAEVPKVGPTTSVRLSWQRVEGAERYHLRVLDGASLITEQWLTPTSYLLQGISQGEYHWSVSALVSDQEKTWETAAAPPISFRVVTESIEPPRILGPRGEVPNPPPDSPRLALRWIPSPGVEQYEVCIAVVDSAEPTCRIVPKPGELEAGQPMETHERVSVPLQETEWSVRPLLEGVDTREQRATARIIGTETPVASDGNGNITLGLQLGYRQARYRFQSAPRATAGELSAQTTDLALQVQLLARRFALDLEVDRASLRIATSSFTTQSYAIAVSPPSRTSLGNTGWSLSPQIGVELREYLLIYPDASLLINNDAVLASQRTSVGGPSVRLNLMRHWLKRFTIGAFASGHLPLLLLDGLPTGSSLSDPLGSLAWRAALEAGYWNKSQTWGALLSVGWSRQRIQSSLPLNDAPATESAEASGAEFTLGLRSRF